MPLLIDGDLRLNESRAIAAYLVRKCGQTTRLYSEDDLQVRARVDQRLYFDMGTFFPAIQEDFVISHAAQAFRCTYNFADLIFSSRSFSKDQKGFPRTKRKSTTRFSSGSLLWSNPVT